MKPRRMKWNRRDTNTKVWLENLNRRDHLEDLDVEDIRTDLRERGWGGVDWIHLAQYRDEWQALVNMVMNFWVP
jgi:hypothetical protein